MKVNGIALTALLSVGSALELDVTDQASIKAAASKIAKHLVENYPLENNLLSQVAKPYYWWETGLYWSVLFDYVHLTKDTSIVSKADIAGGLTSQLDNESQFFPTESALGIGNDDQTYWALAALTAAEYNLVDKPEEWLDVVKNVWNSQAVRWDTATCDGGLRSQIFSFNQGYDYMNAASNMNFLLLSARMAKNTGNTTYVDWATKIYEWSNSTGLISSEQGDGPLPPGKQNPYYGVYDGFKTGNNCSEVNQLMWSSTGATAAYAAAVLASVNSTYDEDLAALRANHDNAALTKEAAADQIDHSVPQSKSQWQLWFWRESAILYNVLSNFAWSSVNTTNYEDNEVTGVLNERACESVGTCNEDQKAYKAITSSYLWKMSQLDRVNGKALIDGPLIASAKAAAASCTDDGVCGFTWTEGKFDNDTGAGQQLAALEIIISLIGANATAPSGFNGYINEQSGTVGGEACKDCSNATDISGSRPDTTGSGATIAQTGAATSFESVSATWRIGALVLGFAAFM